MAYFVQKQVNSIRSNPTYLRYIADQTRSKYDQPTLYRRPPRCTPAQHTTCGERDHPDHFSTGRKTDPAHHDLSERAQPTPLYFRPTYALPDQGPLIADPPIFPERERAGVDRLSGVNGPLVMLRMADDTRKHACIGKTGLNNWSISKSQKGTRCSEG